MYIYLLIGLVKRAVGQKRSFRGRFFCRGRQLVLRGRGHLLSSWRTFSSSAFHGSTRLHMGVQSLWLEVLPTLTAMHAIIINKNSVLKIIINSNMIRLFKIVLCNQFPQSLSFQLFSTYGRSLIVQINSDTCPQWQIHDFPFGGACDDEVKKLN